MLIKKNRAVVVLNMVMAAALYTLPAIAESTAQDGAAPKRVHWAFSSFFGSGWYQIEDNRSVFVWRIPPRQTLRSASISETGEREIGIAIRYPFTLGLHKINDLEGILDADNFGTVSFTPGFEIDIPINQRWSVKPAAYLGYGREFQNDNSAWMYGVGLRSRYAFSAQGEVIWGLLAGADYVGINPDRGRSDSLTAFTLGVDVKHPMFKANWNNGEVDASWLFTYTWLDSEVSFFNPEGRSKPIDDVFEIGLALSPRGRPFNFWLYKPMQLGLSIQYSPEGDYVGIKFNSRSFYTR